MEYSDDDNEFSNEPRWGRQLKNGDYGLTVLDAVEGFTNKNAAKITVTFLVDATDEQAPEGPVKIDYHAVVKQRSMQQLWETFIPGYQKGQKVKSFDPQTIIGAKCRGTTKWEEQAGYKPKAQITSIRGPASFPAATAPAKPAKPAATDDEIPF